MRLSIEESGRWTGEGAPLLDADAWQEVLEAVQLRLEPDLVPADVREPLLAAGLTLMELQMVESPLLSRQQQVLELCRRLLPRPEMADALADALDSVLPHAADELRRKLRRFHRPDARLGLPSGFTVEDVAPVLAALDANAVLVRPLLDWALPHLPERCLTPAQRTQVSAAADRAAALSDCLRGRGPAPMQALVDTLVAWRYHGLLRPLRAANAAAARARRDDRAWMRVAGLVLAEPCEPTTAAGELGLRLHAL